jgi:nitrite reductase/ring-hydroxylating ferredoxin subunit/uncharacterized membrane protein
MFQKLVKLIEDQSVLDDVSGVMKRTFDDLTERIPNRQGVMDFLHGVWLGHPLHPVLTDLPIGAWTVAAIIDATSPLSKRPPRSATAPVAIGVAGSTLTALAGLADWYHLGGKTRRLGTAHSLLNSAALLCYSGSLACRLRGGGPARSLSFLGLGLVTVSGYLGGELVYRYQIGVGRQPEAEPPEHMRVVSIDSPPAEGEMRAVEVAGYPVLLARSGGRLYAVSDTCTHLGCSLAEGRLDDGSVICSCHGSRFSLSDGSVLDGPATTPLNVFNVEVREGYPMVGEPAYSGQTG